MGAVSEAVTSGSKLKTLYALRDSIAKTIDGTESGRDVAALSKRLMEVMDEIEQLEASQKPKESAMSKRRAKRA